MINDFVVQMIAGLTAPRRSVRRLLDGEPPRTDTLLGILLLSYLIQAMAALIVPGARPEIPGSLLAWHVAGFTFQVVIFLLSSVLVLGIGRLFGGTGTLPQSLLVMAWYGLVTSLLSPFILIGWSGAAGGEPSALSALLLLGASGMGLVLLAACVAELHGFRSVLIVLGAIFGLSVLLSFGLLSVMPPA